MTVVVTISLCIMTTHNVKGLQQTWNPGGHQLNLYWNLIKSEILFSLVSYINLWKLVVLKITCYVMYNVIYNECDIVWCMVVWSADNKTSNESLKIDEKLLKAWIEILIEILRFQNLGGNFALLWTPWHNVINFKFAILNL